MEIEKVGLRLGLIEGGLTGKELDSLDEKILDTYVEELSEKLQTDFEHRLESIIKDIRESHLAPTPWLVILHEDHYAGPDVSIGMEIDIIVQQHDEDILHLAKTMEQLSGKTITIIPLEYAGVFATELKRMIGRIHAVRRHAIQMENARSKGRSIKLKALHYTDITRVNIDKEFKRQQEEDLDDEDLDDEEDEATTRVHIGR